MATYRDLPARIDRGDVVILDGAVGTGLQSIRPLRAGLPARIPVPRRR